MVAVLPSRAATRSIAWVTFFLARAAVSAFQLRQPHGRQDRAGPGAEILGGDVGPADLFQVAVDVSGGDILALACMIEILKQVLAGQFLAGSDDPGDAPIGGR